jgi:hypothetical protein
MKKLLWSFPLYVLLLPLFFVLHHNNELFGFIAFHQSAAAFGLCVLYLVIWTVLFYLFNRSLDRSAFIAFLIGIYTLYFGDYLDFLKSVFGHSFFSSYKFVVPFSVIVMVLVSKYQAGNGDRIQKVKVYLNVVMILFVFIEVISSIVYFIETPSHHNLIYPLKPISSNYRPSEKKLNEKPDIYFIVFDAYTNATTLKKLWKFNNRLIETWLEENGFYIADSSKSNYNFTPFSIASTLNMDYLNPRWGAKGNVPEFELRAVRSMSENETISLLKKEDYQVRYFTPFESNIEDIGLYHEFSDFGSKEFYRQTFPNRFKLDVLWNFVSGKFNFGIKHNRKIEELPLYKNYVQRANDIATTINKLKETADSSSNRRPQFVYAHFLITHQPHLFDSTGNLKKGLALISQRNLFETYTHQVMYANRVITELVEWIKLHNKKNTIIIIEGDHGFRDFPPSMDSFHFPNLNTIYFPDKDYNRFYPQLSPVNTFRIVFNHYFGQNLPLLKDSCIFVKF